MYKEDNPRLFKTLSRDFGARKAVKLMSLMDAGSASECAVDLSGVLIWSETQQGHDFWAKLDDVTERRLRKERKKLFRL